MGFNNVKHSQVIFKFLYQKFVFQIENILKLVPQLNIEDDGDVFLLCG